VTQCGAHSGKVFRCHADGEAQWQIHRLAQGLHRAAGLDATGTHDRQPVHPLLDLGKDVGGDDHGHPLAAQLPQDGVETADGFGVETGRGFVEKQDAWRAEQGLGETEALAHAFGVLAHPPFCGMGQADALEHGHGLLRRNTLEAGEKMQGFEPGQVVIEHDVLRQVADAAPHGAEVGSMHCCTVDTDLA